MDKHRANIIITFNIAPLLASVLELLLASKFITDQQVAELHASNPTNYSKGPSPNVRMTMYRLRSEMKRFDIEINHNRNAGYWISQETKDRINALLDSEVLHDVKLSEVSEAQIPNGCDT